MGLLLLLVGCEVVSEAASEVASEAAVGVDRVGSSLNLSCAAGRALGL